MEKALCIKHTECKQGRCSGRFTADWVSTAKDTLCRLQWKPKILYAPTTTPTCNTLLAYCTNQRLALLASKALRIYRALATYKLQSVQH